MTTIPHAIVRRTTNFVTSSTTPVIVDTLDSSNFVAGRKYLIMAQYQWSGNTTVQEYKFQLTHGATPTIFPGSEGTVEIPTTATRLTYSFFTVHTAVAGEDVDLRAFVDDDTAATMTIRLGTLVAIEISEQFTEGVDWHFNQNIASTALPNSPTFTTTNNAIVTFTPPVAGNDWLILAQATIDSQDVTVQFNSRLRRTGEATENFPLYSQEGEDANFEDLLPHFMARTATLGAVSNSFETDSNKESGASASTRESSHVFAINLNKFKSHSESFIQTGITVSDENDFADSTRVATASLSPQETNSDILVLGAFSKSRNENSGLQFIIARMQVNNNDTPDTQTAKSYDQLDGWDSQDKLAWRMVDILATPGLGTQRVDIDVASDDTVVSIGDRLAVLLELEKDMAQELISVDALLRAQQTETITNDAIVVNVETETILVDARLAVRREVLVDAFLNLRQTETVLVDSILIAQNTATPTVDSILVKENTETITVDAILRKQQTETVLVDSILVNRNAETITADSILVNRNAETITNDSILVVKQTNNISLDATLEQAKQTNISVDSILVGTKLQILVDAIVGMIVPIMVDAQLSLAQTETATVDALLRKVMTTDISVDALLRKQQAETILADSILVNRNTETITTDSILVNRNTTTPTLDALLRAVQANAITVDSQLMLQAQTATIQVDANIGQASTANVIADAVLKRIIQETSLIDARLDVVTQTSITVDAERSFPFLELRTVDAILLAIVPAPVAISVDGILDQAGQVQIFIDSALRGPETAIVSVDATIETPNIQIVVTADAIIVSIPTASPLVDAKVVTRSIKDALVDSRIVNKTTLPITVDSNIEQIFQAQASIDATIEQAKITIDSLVDSILVNRNNAQAIADAHTLFKIQKQVSVDADLKLRIPLGVSVDSNIQALGQQIPLLVDALTFIFPSIFSVANARLLAIQAQITSIDAILIRANQITLDAKLGVGEIQMPILVDANLRIPRRIRSISEIRDNIFSTSIIRRQTRT